MKINTSTKVFLAAVIVLVAAFATFQEARSVYEADFHPVNGSWGVDYEPDLNKWHYWTAALVTISIGLTISATVLSNTERRTQKGKDE
ncbi:hypothetical protein BH10ACI2_BH10ACI2_20510 [soil metagenome]